MTKRKNIFAIIGSASRNSANQRLIENFADLTSGLLQGWRDIGAMVILSLLCFIWAGRTLLGFCLLTCTFISLISSGSGRTSNEFQPCSKPCPLAKILLRLYLHCITVCLLTRSALLLRRSYAALIF